MKSMIKYVTAKGCWGKGYGGNDQTDKNGIDKFAESPNYSSEWH